MSCSVREKCATGIGAPLACLLRLHSHFMAEWKPALVSWWIGNDAAAVA
jgi:hypothetical protein